MGPGRSCTRRHIIHRTKEEKARAKAAAKATATAKEKGRATSRQDLERWPSTYIIAYNSKAKLTYKYLLDARIGFRSD